MSKAQRLISKETKIVIAILAEVALVVLCFYFVNFNTHISSSNGDWGTFGDYVGGILNPIIAGFAFYLISKTYELQKSELNATKRLLNDQTRLAALTALLDTNLAKINLLNLEINSLFQQIDLKPKDIDLYYSEDFEDHFDDEKIFFTKIIRQKQSEILTLLENNKELEKQIKEFLKI